ncbi:unnamed protein product [Protopolystoma xenopodis]|uniref:Uncharacterized protein n=1 Tax=Protopolystoma xenopodis TaxID=117903 RepID=A0A3S5CP32_9PLAT|nr:unnamed protein product [Protopolystoma xenopodis]
MGKLFFSQGNRKSVSDYEKSHYWSPIRFEHPCPTQVLIARATKAGLASGSGCDKEPNETKMLSHLHRAGWDEIWSIAAAAGKWRISNMDEGSALFRLVK